MNYTVRWIASAEQHLATLWLAALDRAAVTSASHAIDQLLAENPEAVGIVNFDTVRTLVVEPLGVDFEAIDADRLVFVLAVWPVNTGAGDEP